MNREELSRHRCERPERWAEYDGHGYFLTYVCPQCRADKLAGYRPDIFGAYDCDEDLEPEPGVINADEWQDETMPGDYDRDMY